MLWRRNPLDNSGCVTSDTTPVFVARNTIKHGSYLLDVIESLVILYRALPLIRILAQQKIQKVIS